MTLLWRAAAVAVLLVGGAMGLRPRGRMLFTDGVDGAIDGEGADEIMSVTNNKGSSAANGVAVSAVGVVPDAVSTFPAAVSLPVGGGLSGGLEAFMQAPQLHSRPYSYNTTDSAANDVDNLSWKEVLIAMGDGSGFSAEDYRYSPNSRRMRTVLRYQHLATSIVIVVLFCGFLCIGLSMVHWQVEAQVAQLGAVKYFALVGSELASVEDQELPGFLEAFDKPPSEACLVVTGWELLERNDDAWAQDHFDPDRLLWQGERYQLAFSFALDVCPWLRPNCLPDGDSSDDEQPHLIAGRPRHGADSAALGVCARDQEQLQNFLRQDRNALSTVELHKEVAWPEWEELALNIRTHLRQKGFNGLVQVGCRGSEEVTIHKNSQWAHFMRSRATRVIAALSIFGWFFYELYMWCRQRKLVVRSTHRVDIPVHEYWHLVEDKITANGFVPSEGAQDSMLGLALTPVAWRSPGRLMLR